MSTPSDCPGASRYSARSERMPTTRKSLHKLHKPHGGCRCTKPSQQSSVAAVHPAHPDLFRLLIGWRDWRSFDSTNDTEEGMSAVAHAHTPSPAMEENMSENDTERCADTLLHTMADWERMCPTRGSAALLIRIPPPRSGRHRRPRSACLLIGRLFCLVMTLACLTSLGTTPLLVIAQQQPPQQPDHIAHHRSYASSSPSSSSSSGSASYSASSSPGNFIRHEATLFTNQSMSALHHPPHQTIMLNHRPAGSPDATISVGCSACRLRKQVEDLSLDSFKSHILQRLHIDRPPNVSKPIVSDSVLRKFYSDNGYRYIRLKPVANGESASSSRSSSSGGSSSSAAAASYERMQGDEPSRPASSDTAQSSAKPPARRRHHSGRRAPGERHPAAASVIYEDESGDYEVDEEYYETVRRDRGSSSSSSGGSSRRLSSSGMSGPSRRKQHAARMLVSGAEDHGNGNDDEDDDDDDEELMQQQELMYEQEYDFEEPDESAQPFVEEFYSSTHSMFAFPKATKARHRGDILEFDIVLPKHLAITSAVFHLHVHGVAWVKEAAAAAAAAASVDAQHQQDTNNGSPSTNNNNRQLLAEALAAVRRPNRSPAPLSISLNRLLRQQRYTRTDADYDGRVPSGAGRTIEFNVTDLAQSWVDAAATATSTNGSNSSIGGNHHQELVLKTAEPWMRALMSLEPGTVYSPYIELVTRDITLNRRKRDILSYDCTNKEQHCCRYPLRVNFRKFGWDWVIAPDVYEAFYCAGDCPMNHLPRSSHTFVSSLSASISPCCSPQKMSPLRLLYFDKDQQVILTVIPNMAVEQCTCS